MFDVYATYDQMRDEDLDALETALYKQRNQTQYKNRSERQRDARFAEGKEAYEVGEPVETLRNADQVAGWYFAKGQAENSGTFEWRDCDEMEADLIALRNGTLEPLVSFEGEDDDTGYSESTQPYLW